MIHNEDCLCEMCIWAQDTIITPTPQAPATTAATTTFEHDWNHAPSGRRHRVEQEDALYWYTAGARAKEAELMEVFNGDLKEILRVARERIPR